MRRRLVPCLAAVSLLTVCGSAQAADTTRVPVGSGTFKVKPQVFTTAMIDPGQFDESSYQATKLRWSSWGKSVTTARGRLRLCVIGYGKCRTYTGRVKFRRAVASGGCGDQVISYKLYSRVRFSNPDGSYTPWLSVSPC